MFAGRGLIIENGLVKDLKTKAYGTKETLDGLEESRDEDS